MRPWRPLRSAPARAGAAGRAAPLALALAVLVAAPVAGLACTPRTPTQETDPGPHDYSVAAGSARLWGEGDDGEPLFLHVRVLDTCGKPVAGAHVQVLHANADGNHEPDRWRAAVSADERGAVRLVTVFPGYTGGIPRHIHFIISDARHETLVTRLFFINDPAVDHGIRDLAMVLEEVPRGAGRSWAASYEFVLRAK